MIDHNLFTEVFVGLEKLRKNSYENDVASAVYLTLALNGLG